MALFAPEPVLETPQAQPIPQSEIDALLVAQLLVAWAGEGGDEPRLGWWRSELVSEFGGQDLFGRLLPHTWPWAVLQGAREAARRRDAELRSQDHDPDRLISLYNLGFEIDERLDERLQDLKRSGQLPQEALPGLKALLGESDAWDRAAFSQWVKGHGEVSYAPSPSGRLIKGAPPLGLGLLSAKLIAALHPVEGRYPLPHFRRSA